MKPTGDEKHEEACRRLLEEGARSYLDAVSALIAYRHEVQKMCRTVLEKHLDDYSSALKVRLERSEIRDAEWPSFAEWEGDGWTLGVKIVREKITPAIRWWETWCSLECDSDDAGLYCWIGEEFPAKQKATALFRKFHPLNNKVQKHGKILMIPQCLKVEEVCNLEINLEDVVQQWIELWKKVGGIEEAFEE
jgi:hypothetical protein